MVFPAFYTLAMLALAMRLLWAFLIPVDPVSDSAAYAIFASNIAEYGVYGFEPDTPGAYWAVGPAALYAAAFAVFGTGSGFAVVTVNLVSSMIILAGIYDLGRRWYGEASGRAAALLFALWPLAIQYTTVLASELHFMALTLLALSAWDRIGSSARGAAWLAVAGLAFAGATYMRPIALLIPAALALSAIARNPSGWFRASLRAAMATAIILAAVAPWSARNERVFGEPVFMSTNFWANFWMGNHPGTSGQYTPLPEETAGMPETERAAYMKALSLEALQNDPAGLLWRTVWKAAKLHERETIGVVWNEAGISALAGRTGVTLLKLVSTAWWYAVLLTALAGAALLIRKNGPKAIVLSVPVWLWLYYTGVHAVIVVGDRYHMPAIPMIAILAAVAVSRIPVLNSRASGGNLGNA